MTTGGDGIKVRLSNENSGKKLFINLCSHDALQPPLDSLGNPVYDDRINADGLQITLLIGPVRDVEDSHQIPSLAIDIIFHPIIIDRCKLHTGFKKQIIELVFYWIKKDTKITFESNYKILKTTYMGGRGFDKNTPVLFSVDYAMQQSNSTTSDDLGIDGKPLNSNQLVKRNSSAMTSPTALLEYVKSDKNQMNDSNILSLNIDSELLPSNDSKNEMKKKSPTKTIINISTKDSNKESSSVGLKEISSKHKSNSISTNVNSDLNMSSLSLDKYASNRVEELEPVLSMTSSSNPELPSTEKPKKKSKVTKL